MIKLSLFKYGEETDGSVWINPQKICFMERVIMTDTFGRDAVTQEWTNVVFEGGPRVWVKETPEEIWRKA